MSFGIQSDPSLWKCKQLQVLKHHTSDVTALDFGAKFYLASVSSDKSIAIWEWTPGLGYTQVPFSPLTAHNYAITKVKFSPDGNSFVTSAYDGNIIHWNLKDGSIIHTFVHSNNSAVRSISFCSKQHTLISGGDDGSICMWNLNSKLCDSSWLGHEEAVSTLALSPDEQCLVSSDLTSQTKVWTVTGEPPQLLCAVPAFHELGTNEINFSSVYGTRDNSTREYKLVSCGNDDNLLKLWILSYDLARGRVSLSPLASLQGHTSAVTSVRFNNKSSLLVSGSMDKTVKLWDVPSLTCIKTLESHTRYVTCCTFSCDDSLLASGSNDKTVTIWDMRGNLGVDPAHSGSLYSSVVDSRLVQLVDKFTNLGNAINSVDVSHGKLIAAGGSDKNIWLWSSQEGTWVPHPSSPLSPHQYPVHQVEFSSCGTMMTSCSLDGTALVFDIKGTELILRGSVHIGSNMRCVRFSPDTRLLATGGDDETVTVWRSDDLSLIMPMKGHVEAISCVAFTLDSHYLLSGCVRGNYRLWSMTPCISICLYHQEDAHDLGVAYVEFVPHSGDSNDYLFVSCGNDALIKVWSMHVLSELKVHCTHLRTLRGHGGDVTCVKYIRDNIIVSSSVDKTLRFWNQESGEMLHVHDTKDSPLTCVAYSPLPPLLVSGSLDKTVLVWGLNTGALSQNVPGGLNTAPLTPIVDGSTSGDRNSIRVDQVELSEGIPAEMMCPITHQLMRDPVLCSDGYNYERSAIELWISSGRSTSPLTNQPLLSTDFVANSELKTKIDAFIQTQGKPGS
ncbi:hypothetical protein M8J75_016612 [Diaphorina citri]|nr:hypothetical protein M8J75_016612 [Diaphorina citri]